MSLTVMPILAAGWSRDKDGKWTSSEAVEAWREVKKSARDRIKEKWEKKLLHKQTVCKLGCYTG